MTLPRIVEGQHHPLDGAVGIYVYTPYRESFVEELKVQVPRGQRRWMEGEGAWWVGNEWAEWATQLVGFHFGSFELVDEDGVIELHESDGTVSRQESLF